MSRAKRIEEAARAIFAYEDDRQAALAGFPDWDRNYEALRAALALPEEESEVGWTVRRGSEPLIHAINSACFYSDRDAATDDCACTDDPTDRVVRLRVTVEPEPAPVEPEETPTPTQRKP